MKSNHKYLYCPIRGELKITEKDSKDKFTEEFRRIELIRFLLNKGYKKDIFGFEKTILKYGSQGKNTLKSDLVIYSHQKKQELDDIILICEVKKNSIDKDKAIEFQLKPAFKQLKNCKYAIYWDNENRLLFRKDSDDKFVEYSVLKTPDFEQNFQNNLLSYDSLVEIEIPTLILTNLEQKIHNLGGTNKNFRYNEIFKLFLIKYYDESKNKRNRYVEFQIFKSEDAKNLETRLQKLYCDAIQYYSINSPIELDTKLKLNPKIIEECVKLLQDYSLMKTSQLILQEFFMYFAPIFLRKELDQYYTPQEIVDFITDVLLVDNIKIFIDPCGGSADFLVGLIKKGLNRKIDNIKDNAFYFDISQDAVNVASLNMILNGDGRSNAECIDSIEKSDYKNNCFHICVTNPPFGQNTIWGGDIEKMKDYDIAKDGDNLKVRELGVLFIERCIKFLNQNGILAIIVPNGYLTNPSQKYIRNFLLNKGKIIGCVSLPEDVFKKSNASGFTDILFFQKTKPTNDNYRIFSGVAEKIGFEQTKKKTPPIFKRTDDGNYVLKNNRRVKDNDLLDIVDEFKQFSYDENLIGFEKINSKTKYSFFYREDLINDSNRILAPRRFHRNYIKIIQKIKSQTFMTLNQMNAKVTNKKDCHISKTKQYIYLDTGELFNGQYRKTNRLKGWQLPNRAKLSVKKNDIFIAKTKGCFNKFCMIVENNENIIATNGFYRIRIEDKDERLNFFSFLFTESYMKQMEALTTGTILADVKDWDLIDKLYIPKLKNIDHIEILIQGFEKLVEL